MAGACLTPTRLHGNTFDAPHNTVTKASATKQAGFPACAPGVGEIG